MNARGLFFVAGALFLVAVVTLATVWKGSAGVSAGWPPSAWAINFCGSANGWPALVGVSCLVLALFVFLAATVSGATRGRPR